MRKVKKDYVSDILDKNKTYIKVIWNVLNYIMRNGSMSKCYPKCLMEENKTVK